MKGFQLASVESRFSRCEAIARWNRTLFESCIKRANACVGNGRPEEALQWCSTAGWFASRKGWFGELSSRGLETELLQVAESFPTPARSRRGGGRARWLHVLSEAYSTLGHSNLCRRWIEFDQNVTSDVMLLDQ